MTRLDQLLVERGLVESREKAQRAIMAGLVTVDGRRVDKAGARTDPAADLEVSGPAEPFVSRAGRKLDHALTVFGVDVDGRVCLDVGASTGGFTDCLLQRGAARVYAVDVGYGQLDMALRRDERVVVMERCNARHLKPADLPELCDLAVLDVSFISLLKVVPAVVPLLRPGAEMMPMVKPQFEAGRDKVGKGGVVRDAARRREIVGRTLAGLEALGLELLGSTDSPVAGAKGGNIETFGRLRVP